MLAGRALNLPTGKLRFTLQWLIAMGTIEFEFIRVHSRFLYKRIFRPKDTQQKEPIWLPLPIGDE